MGPDPQTAGGPEDGACDLSGQNSGLPLRHAARPALAVLTRMDCSSATTRPPQLAGPKPRAAHTVLGGQERTHHSLRTAAFGADRDLNLMPEGGRLFGECERTAFVMKFLVTIGFIFTAKTELHKH